MNSSDKTAALTKIGTINEVEGFDPSSLAVEYTDLNKGETRLRLPVMAQVAWFRLKYPEGRFTLSVVAAKDFFVATARVYKNYMDPVDCFLSEATASRGYIADKPTISPREWAQTAALGIALRNAGFGLQFHTAGESFDEPAVDELKPHSEQPPANTAEAASDPSAESTTYKADTAATVQLESATPAAPAEDPLESAKKMSCPISKYMGKTLGDMISIDAGALVWVANKFTGDPAIKDAAKLICENALAVTA